MNHIITISRQHGSGGREIGALVAKKLNIPFYDNSLIQLASEESGFSEEHFRDYDKYANNSFLYSLVRGFQYHQNATGVWSLEDNIYSTQAKVIRDIADKGPCVIIGRCADYLLSERPELVKIFIYGSLDARAERVSKAEGISIDETIEVIKNTDKRRKDSLKKLNCSWIFGVIKNLAWCSFLSDNSVCYEENSCSYFSCKSHFVSYDNHCHSFVSKFLY